MTPPFTESPPALPSNAFLSTPASHPLFCSHCITFGTAALTQSRCQSILSRGEALSRGKSAYYTNSCSDVFDSPSIPLYYFVIHSTRPEGRPHSAVYEGQQNKKYKTLKCSVFHQTTQNVQNASTETQ